MKTATAAPVAEPASVSVSQWACCQFLETIMAQVSTTATGHQRRRCRAGTRSTAMTTTSAAIRELCPDGNAHESVSTMMSAGRGRSPTALPTSVMSFVAVSTAQA
ncbi:hypothetical protein J2S68_001465 [Glycomyces algeriensis]|uniref:Uncharacterized protein n=1 Tax=Glycomyces algeriensis TaxID=256037 RepID=A0A9W6G993_9ACTN|nr:hypothetical protein [Glycomyces algeriensis]MDA1365017.1 hypothetical protein [Glycomyces algeriensis]MDR7349922.1 hypothetical protein [Glycomyces algeriensis]GLI42632.1 hypothetical protein GALLR39Z86_24820 [Glycomyces algeriensis]